MDSNQSDDGGHCSQPAWGQLINCYCHPAASRTTSAGVGSGARSDLGWSSARLGEAVAACTIFLTFYPEDYRRSKKSNLEPIKSTKESCKREILN